MVEVILIAPSDEKTFGKINIKNIDADLFPMGIAYIASFLEKNGHNVKLIDLKQWGPSWESKLKQELVSEAPQFVGITCVTPTITVCEEISKLVKDVNKEIKVVLGGPHPSALPNETVMSKYVDIVVVGEGEQTFLELLEQEDMSKIKGICYKEKGKVKLNQPRELIGDLDSIPWPAYDQLNPHLYGNPFLGKCAIIVSGRGCPYNCIFCSSKTINKGKLRLRSVKDVVDEIEYLYKEYNIKGFKFVDDTFTMNPRRTEELCNEIIKRNLKISWACDTRVNTVTENLLKIMKKAGCKLVEYGIETGDEEILKIIKKRISLDQVRNAVRITKKVGIHTHGFFIIGHPYDTDETIRKTIELSKELQLDFIQVSILTPYPGTEVLEMARRKEGLTMLKDQEWDKFKRYDKPVIELPTVSGKRLEEYNAKAYREFYFRPSYILQSLLHTKPTEYSKLFYKAMSLRGFIKKST